MLVPSAIAMPSEVVWAVGGDSLVVTVDGYRGTVRWFAITEAGLVQQTTRTLSWNPQAFRPVDVRDMLNRVQARNPVLAANIRADELILPPFFGQAWRATVDDQGQVWINLFDRAEQSTTNSWLIVPQSQNESTRTVTLPEGFYLRTVADENLYGSVSTDFGVPIIQVLRLREQ